MRSMVSLRRRRLRIDRTSAEQLVLAIWGLEPGKCSDFQLRAYLAHYNDLKDFMRDSFVIRERLSIVTLVNTVRSNAQENVRGLLAAIARAQPPCLAEGYEAQSLKSALAFACKLWLFLDLDLSDEEKHLQDLVSKRLFEVKSGMKVDCDHLSKDFSQKSLYRKAGIGLIWTSDLSQHLELVGSSSIRVFRHTGVLAAYRSQNFSLFPIAMLAETERTIDLLFPTASFKEAKRMKRLSEKDFVDIEVAEPGQRSRDLSVYPTWGGRLSLIQEAFNDSRPKRLKQWYWDRRRRNDWATFWIAVVVFCLTVVFGIISSVTSIMQLVIAYRTLNVTE